MTKPLALVFYERLMPGSQLPNRLEDLGYRVHVLEDGAKIHQTALDEKPIVLIVDLATNKTNIFEVIRQVRQGAETSHIPIIGFAGQHNTKLHDDAVKAGATLVAVDDALMPQLPHLLEQALHVE